VSSYNETRCFVPGTAKNLKEKEDAVEKDPQILTDEHHPAVGGRETLKDLRKHTPPAIRKKNVGREGEIPILFAKGAHKEVSRTKWPNRR